MIQLEKYNEFLKAFEYAKIKVNTNEYSSKSKDIFYKVTEDNIHIETLKHYEDEIKDLSSELTIRLSGAKCELLNNILSLKDIEEKINLINYIFFQFIDEIYQPYSLMYKTRADKSFGISFDEDKNAIQERNENEKVFSNWQELEDYFEYSDCEEEDSATQELWDKTFSQFMNCWSYLKVYCFEAIEEWFTFIEGILKSHNRQLKMTNQIEQVKNNTIDIFSVFDRFYPSNNNSEEIAHFLKDSRKYDIILKLPEMHEYLKKYGGKIVNIPKADIAALLITLLYKGYFQFSTKKELKEVAKKTFGISRVIDDGNDRQRLNLFSFIPEEKELN